LFDIRNVVKNSLSQTRRLYVAQMKSPLDEPLGPSEDCLSSSLIVGYINNGLASEEKTRVESHLVQCEVCRENLENSRNVI